MDTKLKGEVTDKERMLPLADQVSFARSRIVNADPGPMARLISWTVLATEKGMRINQLRLQHIARDRAARGLA